jgi:hypothetical protein
MRHGVAVLLISVLSPLSFSQLDLFAGSFRWEEKTAHAAREHQHGELRAVANSSGDRASDGRQDSADAQVVWRVQERGRFARDSRPRSEAPRQNAQVPDRRKTGLETRSVTISEVPFSGRKVAGQTVREISRFARNDRWQVCGTGGAISAPTSQERKLAETFIQSTWCVGLGWSMRRGTWSAMRIP